MSAPRTVMIGGLIGAGIWLVRSRHGFLSSLRGAASGKSADDGVENNTEEILMVSEDDSSSVTDSGASSFTSSFRSVCDDLLSDVRVDEAAKALRAAFQESKSVEENISTQLRLMIERKLSVLSIEDRAILQMTLKALANGSQDEGIPYALNPAAMGSSKDIKNVVVQEWLRDSFTAGGRKVPERLAPRRRRSHMRGMFSKSIDKGIESALKQKRTLMPVPSPSEEELDSGVCHIPYEVDDEERGEILKFLSRDASWSFDVWAFTAATGGRQLGTLASKVLTEWGCLERFKIDTETLYLWLAFVDEMYADVAFHNSTHATDVLQAVHCTMKTGGLSQLLNPLERFAFLISAIVHDLGHDAMSNNFHKNSVSERSLLYNDQSNQEMFHCTTFFAAMQDNPEINILANLTLSEFSEFRALVIRLVLQTDMTHHFSALKDFKVLQNTLGKDYENWQEHKADVMSMVLHACDISAQARPRSLAIAWAERVHMEFFAQGDAEALLDLPISPLCDRAKTDVTDSQIGFIEFIVLPIWQAIAPLLPILSDEVLHNLKENLNFWKSGAAKKFFGPGFLKRPSTPSPWTSSTSVGLSYGNQGSPMAARAYNRRGTIDGSTDTSAARNELLRQKESLHSDSPLGSGSVAGKVAYRMMRKQSSALSLSRDGSGGVDFITRALSDGEDEVEENIDFERRRQAMRNAASVGAAMWGRSPTSINSSASSRRSINSVGSPLREAAQHFGEIHGKSEELTMTQAGDSGDEVEIHTAGTPLRALDDTIHEQEGEDELGRE